MRRRIAFLLSFLMILSSAATAWAAPGDYMNRQLQRRYRGNIPRHLMALEEDYASGGAEVAKAFYREIKEGVFVNFKEEERAEEEALEAYLKENNLSPGDLANLSKEELTDLGRELQKAKAGVTRYRLGDDGFITEEEFLSYAYPGEATLLEIKSPVAGGVVGSTRFDELPAGYSGWRYKVASSQMPVPTEGEVLIGSYDYSQGRDILVSAGDYLLLVAVNSNNRVQGYRQFPIEEGQIRQAGNVAEELVLGEDYNAPAPGTVAGTIRFTGLTLPAEATQWQYRLRDLPTNPPIEDTRVSDAVDYEVITTDDDEGIGENIPVVAGQYLTLLATDADGKVKKYATIQVKEEDIAAEADSLKHNTHYPASPSLTPVNEGDDYHGNFAWLNFETGSAKLEGAYRWYYHVAEANSFEIPAVGAKIGEAPFFKEVAEEEDMAGFKAYEAGDAIDARVNGVYGDLMLVATDDEDTILAYVILPLSDENVKLPEGEKAGVLQPLKEEVDDGLKHYRFPLEMGTVPGTTRLEILGNGGFGTANRWQIQVSNSPIPIPQEDTRLGNVTMANYYHSSTYPFAGRDIPVKAGDYMMLYLTDSEGFVKGYAKIGEENENDEIVIPEGWVRPPLAEEFRVDQHYSRPSVGAKAGTTRIELLAIPDGVEVYATVVTESVDRPSVGDPSPEATDVINLSKKQKESDKSYVDIKNVQANNSLVLYGVKENDDKKEIHYFSSEMLTAFQIREKDAIALEKIEGANGGHYSAPEIGTKVGHIRIMELDFGDIGSMDNIPINQLHWQAKVQPGALTFEPEGAETIALNTTVQNPAGDYLDNYYMEGKDIPIEAGQHLILYATDHNGRIKGYKDLGKIEADTIAKKAEVLMEIDNDEGHYSHPEKGETTGTTRIKTLQRDSNWSEDHKWYYRVENPPVDYVGIKNLKLDVEEGFKAYNEDEDIPILAGESLILVAVNDEDRIQAYAVMLIAGNQIQLPSATLDGTALNDDFNETHIREGGRDIVITLESGYWVEDIVTNEDNRNALFEGFRALTEDAEWQKVVNQLKAGGAGVMEVNDALDTVTITLSATAAYTIHQYQNVQLTIPPSVIQNATTDTVADRLIEIGPMVSATVSGSVINHGVGEEEIQAGGATIVLTLNKGQWIHGIGRDSDIEEDMVAIRGALFEGMTTQTEGTQWNKVVTALKAIDTPSEVLTRNAPTVLTITLPAVEDYALDYGDQKIDVLIPAGAIINGTTDVEANPSFTIKTAVPYIFDIEAVATEGKDTIAMVGSESHTVSSDKNKWILRIAEDTGTISPNFSKEDIDTINLPANLTIDSAKKVEDSSRDIVITVGGEATSSILNKTEVGIIIKGSGMLESGAQDSQPIPVWIKPGSFEIKAVAEKDIIKMLAPVNREVLPTENTWRIEVMDGTLKEELSMADISIDSLPLGLTTTVEKASDNVLVITVGGTAETEILDTSKVNVTIKASAVMEGGAEDSKPVEVWLEPVEALDLSEVSIDVAEKKLTNTTNAMEYSLNSTDGTDGDWQTANGTEAEPADTSIDGGFSEGKVYVREKGLTHNNRLIAELSYREAPQVVADFSEGPSAIKLLGLKEGMEYNKTYPDGKWVEVTEDNKGKSINLSDQGNWDLRVRFAATKEALASHPTEKLNGMDLTGVGVDVAAGKLTGTTDAMEYSLDSSTGTNGEWHSARNNDTNVNFVEGAVYVREKERRGNYREVANITRQPLENSDINGDEDGDGGISYHVAEGWIQSPIGNLQYRIANGPWRDLESVAEAKTYGVDFQPGKLEFRLGATTTKLPSLAVPHKAIQAAAAPPQLAYDDLHYRIEGLNETTGEGENAVAIYEYRVNDGPWQLGTVVPDFSGDDVVRIRKRATADTLASQQQIINFTQNLNLYTVGLDVANGRLTGTTTAMEYSLDSSNGTNGTWQQAINTNTPVAFVEGRKVHIRERVKPRNFLKLSNGIAKLSPPTDTIDHNIMEGRITIPKAYNNQLQYRIGSGDWVNLPYGEIIEDNAIVGGIPFTSGKLMVRFRATTDKLASNDIEIASIKAPRSAPALTYDDVDYKIFGLDAKASDTAVLYQYKINDGPWKDGTIESSFQGSDRVSIRLKATKDKLPGEVQEIVFTPNIDFSHVGVDVANGRIMGTSTAMEYSLDSSNGEDGTWSPCSNNATAVDFVADGEVYLRQRNKPLNYYRVTQTERQDALDQSELDAIDFHIQEGWLEIPEALVGKLQYRIDVEDQVGDWIDIVATQQVEGKDKMRMTGITFREGKISFRRRATETSMASPAATADKFIIKAAESSPIVKEDHIENTFKIKVGDDFVAVGSNDDKLQAYVYRINEGPWIPANIENDFSGNVRVEVRKKATKTTLPSQIATIYFEKTMDLNHIGLSTHVTPHELNGTTTEMEYNVVNSSGTKWWNEWKSCEEGNTQITNKSDEAITSYNKILVRVKTQPANQIEIPFTDN